MALTEPERIIFSKTINAGLATMPLCGYAAICAAMRLCGNLGSRTTLQSNHVRNGVEKA